MKIPEDLRDAAKKAKEQGWTLCFTRGKHIEWRSPAGGVVITSSTPSGGKRARQNAKALLKRYGLKME